MTITMIQVARDEYQSECGKTLKREDGQTLNGNPIGGNWVLRNKNGVYMDHHQYRNDLASWFGLTLQDTPESERSIVMPTDLISKPLKDIESDSTEALGINQLPRG